MPSCISTNPGACSHTQQGVWFTKTALDLPEKEKELQVLKVEHEGLPVA